MARLIHLNGPPGIGKSTIAQRWAEAHPGTLCCDVDALRTMVGGWREDFASAGTLIRPVALAMITAHLAQDQDVVLPQLFVRPAELDRFCAAATGVGAEVVEVALMDSVEASVARFHRRSEADAPEWHLAVREVVARDGGDESLTSYHRALVALVATRPQTHVVASLEGEVEATYAAVRTAVGS